MSFEMVYLHVNTAVTAVIKESGTYAFLSMWSQEGGQAQPCMALSNHGVVTQVLP
jgi:hypothetical protein